MPCQREAIAGVLPALVGALGDKDEVVRVMSCEVLEQIAGSGVEPLRSKASSLLREKGRAPGECR